MRANDGTGQQGHVTPKHVLVDGEHPGILLDWRTCDGKWQAHVIWSDSDHLPARAHLEWLPEDQPPDMTKPPTLRRGWAVVSPGRLTRSGVILGRSR